MQIDFHHTVIYTLARLAEFTPDEANIIAYSSQYVDDAVNGGFIIFRNHPAYYHLRSAHRTTDTENLDTQANLAAWLPFHFLPGNNSSDADPDYEYIARLVCRPNSDIAQEMVTECIESQNDYNGLYRLGITLHVYADTWAHQGFAGIKHSINTARSLTSHEHNRDFKTTLANLFDKCYDATRSELIDDFFPLGHGATITCPDEPYLVWSYTNAFNNAVRIDNITDRYTEAIQEIFKVLQRFKLKSPTADVSGILANDLDQILSFLKSNDSPDESIRHQAWLDKIAAGDFSFGPETVTYIPKGEGSWKHIAISAIDEIDNSDALFTYAPSFDTSDWKKFHDATKVHWNFVIHELLPKHNIIF